MPLRWVVIGLGSPVAGDDLGWQAVEYVRACWPTAQPPLPECLCLDRPGPALLEYFTPGIGVILVDALQSSAYPAGSVQVLRLEDLVLQARQPSSHQLGVAETLALAQALDQLPECLYLLGIVMPPQPAALRADLSWRETVLRHVRAWVGGEGLNGCI